MEPKDYEKVAALAARIREGEHPRIAVTWLRSILSDVSIRQRDANDFVRTRTGREHLLLEVALRIHQGQLVLTNAIAKLLSSSSVAGRSRALAAVQRLAESDPCVVTRREANKVIKDRHGWYSRPLR